MATTNQIKFYKGSNYPATPAAGMIFFNTSDRSIYVFNGTEWERYAGLVDAAWDASKHELKITTAVGNVITINDLASAASVSQELTRIEGLANDAQDAADAAQADVDAVEEKLGDGFTKDSTVTAQLAAVKATADAAAVRDTVNAALELKADKTQVATDIAAAKSGAEATAAADATAKAEAAQAAAIAEATRLDGLMDARVDALEAAVGAGGSVDEAITAKIEDLDADVTSAEGTQVRVQVVEVDGKITEVKVTESATFATVQALADEIADREADEETINNRIDALDAADTGRVSVLEKKVDALNSATHFEGKVEFDPSAEGATTDGYQSGDIVIYGNKEYIFDGTSWIELGDTTAESSRISSLESWKAEAVQAIADNKAAIESNDADIKALQDADAAQAELNATLATKKELSDEKAALNALIEANGTAITALQGADTTINGRLDGHDDKIGELETAVAGKVAQGDFDTLKGRVDVAESDIDGVQEDVANLQAGTGLADGVSAPVYTGSNYLGSASTMVAADMALDAKIKEVADSVTSKNVSAEGDTYVTATAANNKVTVAAVTGTVESKSGLATNQGVYDALCWVEFE